MIRFVLLLYDDDVLDRFKSLLYIFFWDLVPFSCVIFFVKFGKRKIFFLIEQSSEKERYNIGVSHFIFFYINLLCVFLSLKFTKNLQKGNVEDPYSCF